MKEAQRLQVWLPASLLTTEWWLPSSLARNRLLRGSQYLELLSWAEGLIKAGEPLGSKQQLWEVLFYHTFNYILWMLYYVHVIT